MLDRYTGTRSMSQDYIFYLHYYHGWSHKNTPNLLNYMTFGGSCYRSCVIYEDTHHKQA